MTESVWGVLLDEKWSFVIDQQSWPLLESWREAKTAFQRQKDTAAGNTGSKLALKHGRRYVGSICRVTSGSGWSGFWKGWVSLHCLGIFFKKGGGGGVFSKKKLPGDPHPLTPHCLGGIGCQPPFVYLSLPLSLSQRSFCFSHAFCMKVAICEDYPAWGLKDTVAWVLILTQGRTEDMGSVSNQEFPGWVTK